MSRIALALGGLLAFGVIPASAQDADSLKAAQDSIRLVKELQDAMRDDPGGGNAARPAGSGPTNPRLLPDISAVGDLIGDLSPDGSTQEDGSRFGVREVEIAVQAAVDPYFGGDIFIGFNDVEKVSLEQAYLTTTALPHGLELRVGRYLMPFGKQNLAHRHDLHTVEYPYVIQEFLGPEGLKGTGLQASRIIAPFGFYQELQLTAVDRFAAGEDEEELTTAEPVNKKLSGLGYSARVRNYVDLSESMNLELSGSAITGRRAQPLDAPVGEVNAVAARQSLAGVDFTLRWRPLRQGLYRSFILQTEFMRQFNDANPAVPGGALYAGPTRNVNGAYAFARYQLNQRFYLGSRVDWVEHQDPAGGSLNAFSGVIEFFPSEFSKLIAQYERVRPGTGLDDVDRLLLQASFALGPHKPHPF